MYTNKKAVLSQETARRQCNFEFFNMVAVCDPGFNRTENSTRPIRSANPENIIP